MRVIKIESEFLPFSNFKWWIGSNGILWNSATGRRVYFKMDKKGNRYYSLKLPNVKRSYYSATELVRYAFESPTGLPAITPYKDIFQDEVKNERGCKYSSSMEAVPVSYPNKRQVTDIYSDDLY